MEIHEKNWMIFQVQVDHLTGEEIGGAIEEFYAAGASNVQVIRTITKKGRPGCIFQIDARPDKQEAVENVIVRELASTGWHVIPTRHRYLNVDYLTRNVCFTFNGECVSLKVEAKRAYGETVTLRPEDRSCEAVKNSAAAHGILLSRGVCREILKDIFENDRTTYSIPAKE